MTSTNPAPGTDAEVLVRREGRAVRITLNRPRVINAFNRSMAECVIDAVADANRSDATVMVLDGAGERGFCGGGDIKAMASGSAEEAAEFLRTEYVADYRVATSRIPVVGLMDGITMGGGIGLTGHADVRVVTERSRLAMPETRIGIVPDVGGHLLLSRAPGRLGELLAITSGSMSAADAIALGFADTYVPSDRLERLREAISAGQRPDAAVREVAEHPPTSDLVEAREWFDPIADAALGTVDSDGARGAAHDPVGAAQRLIAALESSDRAEARSAATTVRGMCPVSIAVTLAQIDRTRRASLDLRAVLIDDLRVLGRLVGRHDFREGVRAQIIDKDGAPRWNPAAIEQLDRAEVSRILAPFAEGEVPLNL